MTTHVFESQRTDQLRLAPRQLRLPTKHLHSIPNLALLQTELRKCSHGSLAFRIDLESFVATLLGGSDVLFPLVQSEAFVH